MRYRKKAIEVDAFQFGAGDPTHARPSWFVAAINRGDVWYQGGDYPYYTIKTLEGEMRAIPGDWIIRGVHGEIYPCRPTIFAATYDPVQ